MEEEVSKVLDEFIKPALQADGGSIKLLSVEDGVVKVELEGACAGCPGAKMTMKMGVERILKEKIPAVKEVVSVN